MEPARAGWSFNKWRKTKKLRRYQRLMRRHRNVHERAVALEVAEAGIIVNDYYPVCLVDNGAFTAAAVCYDERELEAFKRDDGRRKAWFQVHKDDLYTVSDLARYEG